MVIWIKQEKCYDIERAAGALAKIPGHKSDLKDFTLKKKNDDKKVLVIERAAGALAKFPGHKSDLKDFEELKNIFEIFWFWFFFWNEQITCNGKDQGATAEYLI